LIVEIAVYPLGTGSTSFSREVASVVRALEEGGFEPEVGPMGTVVEAEDLEEALEAIRVAHEEAVKHADRVVLMVRIDDRRDREVTARGKVEAVKRRLQEE
jgi:uncharacterized protein (TIGR00106 family)